MCGASQRSRLSHDNRFRPNGALRAPAGATALDPWSCRWTTWLQWLDYMLANIGFFTQQGLILYFWLASYNALRKRELAAGMRPVDLYKWAVILYAGMELVLLFVYFGSGFYTIALAHSIIQAVCSFAAATVFVVLFVRLRHALEPSATLLVAKRNLRAKRPSRTPVAAASQPVAHSPLGVSYGTASAAEEAARAETDRDRHRKMSKIQSVAVVCTLANLFRCVMMVYQAVLFGQGEFSFPDFWWLLIMLDYGFTEIFAFGAVLYILRKPTQRRVEGTSASEVAEGGAPPSAGTASYQSLPVTERKERAVTGSTVSMEASSRSDAVYYDAEAQEDYDLVATMNDEEEEDDDDAYSDGPGGNYSLSLSSNMDEGVEWRVAGMVVPVVADAPRPSPPLMVPQKPAPRRGLEPVKESVESDVAFPYRSNEK
jgi:hypothetical protein